MNSKANIELLHTGVPGLDEILGGGLPEFSFNLLVGAPGSGKTTFAHQMMFALANPQRKALFFTVLGEPPLKMLRYQQQFSFFDMEKFNSSIRFVNLNTEVCDGKFDLVLARIAAEVEQHSPGLVFVDSFRSFMLEHNPLAPGGTQQVIQQLGTLLSGWQATTFLIGEYVSESDPNAVFTVADGLIALSQSVYRNSIVRKLQVVKMRGVDPRPGIHAFRMTADGLEVFPAAATEPPLRPSLPPDEPLEPSVLLHMGIAGLDEMMGGGLPLGYSLLIAGPSGSGKTILASAFLAEGVRAQQHCVLVTFEQAPGHSWIRELDDLVTSGKISVLNTRALDLSIDEVLQYLVGLVRKQGSKRIVIDSLSGFELTIAPIFREDFRESLFRLVGVLSELGVSVLMTSELEDRYDELRFSPYGSAFLTDAIVVQRYIEMKSKLQRVMAVVKVRGRKHSEEIRQYDIDDHGIRVGDPIPNYEGLLAGRPSRAGNRPKDGGGEK